MEVITLAQKRHQRSEADKQKARVRAKRYYEDHKESILGQAKDLYAASPEYRDKMSEKSRIYRRTNAERLRVHDRRRRLDPQFRAKAFAYTRQPKERYRDYRDSARRRKIVWDLSLEQFEGFWQKPCSYCGEGVETIGLDRVDNAKGYILDNVVSCCRKCNYAKRSMSRQEYIELCQKVAKCCSGMIY